jgi:hypothetical protein
MKNWIWQSWCFRFLAFVPFGLGMSCGSDFAASQASTEESEASTSPVARAADVSPSLELVPDARDSVDVSDAAPSPTDAPRDAGLEELEAAGPITCKPGAFSQACVDFVRAKEPNWSVCCTDDGRCGHRLTTAAQSYCLEVQ